MCVGRNVFTNKKSDEALNGDLGGLLQIETFVGLFCLRSGRKEEGVEHGCTCTEAGILLDIFTPMREDFV